MNMFSLIPTTAEIELGDCGGTCDGCDGCLGCYGQQKPGGGINPDTNPK